MAMPQGWYAHNRRVSTAHRIERLAHLDNGHRAENAANKGDEAPVECLAAQPDPLAYPNGSMSPLALLRMACARIIRPRMLRAKERRAVGGF